MPVAITRKISPNIEMCELTHLERELIDVDEAARQHGIYEECLRSLGCDVLSLAAEEDLPDSVFVEDTAVVVDELAIIARPGVESRRQETASIADALKSYRQLAYIEAPGTLDGGDVQVVGKDVYAGSSTRTNLKGIEQLSSILGPVGYRVIAVPVRSCLHLKAAAGLVAPGTMLINPEWVDREAFRGIRLLEVDPSEPRAASALLVGESVVYPDAFGKTRRRLEQFGISVTTVDLSELAKAESGVTCCSIVFEE
jgi:dimethylargininase